MAGIHIKMGHFAMTYQDRTHAKGGNTKRGYTRIGYGTLGWDRPEKRHVVGIHQKVDTWLPHTKDRRHVAKVGNRMETHYRNTREHFLNVVNSTELPSMYEALWSASFC